MLKLIVLSFLLLSLNASIVNLDESTLVYVEPGLYKYMSLSSNPTTGYSWVVVPFDSDLFFIEDLGYLPINTGTAVIPGAGGTQNYIAYASSECSEGDSIDITLVYVKVWENIPADTRLVTIQATFDPEKLKLLLI